ncbi:MAG TPA: DUF2334 domain-containing protein [Solirubrobacteraceae bacterium]|nr:DUF2334 domain-containing protein [Solirubrobacteraceae bacterium]
MTEARSLAVALHDVEPATFKRCVRIRKWLEAQGVDRATLLVIPAADLHPFEHRSPELRDWLKQQIRAGDAVAQHGFLHRQAGRGAAARQFLANWQGRGAAEFVGLGAEETLASLLSGKEILLRAGIEPRGFVAPCYAYTPHLRRALSTTFDWWADLLRVHRDDGNAWLAPAHGLGTSSVLKLVLSPATLRLGARGRTVRVDIHPADFDHPRNARALATVLSRGSARRKITYDELVGL